MTIYKVPTGLPTSIKISNINDMIIELSGQLASAKFDKNEIDSLYTGTSLLKQYNRNIAIGNISTGANAWYNFSHLRAESGYSIWRFYLDNYRHNDENKLYFDDKVLIYMGNADSENTTAFAKVFLYDSAEYIDDTEEAGTEGGIEFSLMSATTHYLYIGDAGTFSGIAFDFQTFGAYYSLIVEYYNGSSWSSMSLGVNDLIDNTSNFTSNGKITFAIPSNWAETSVNASTQYWIRISTSTTPTTTAKAYYIMPTESVPTLLKLSSDEILNESWKWCYYGNPADGHIYITLRNDGATAYEGDYYIKSSSSDANKENYFRYLHSFALEYDDSIYTGASAGAGFSRIDPRVNNQFYVGQYQKAFRGFIVKDQYGTNYYQIYVSGASLYAHPLLSTI